MPNYQKRIVYLSDEQCHELFLNGTITVDGVTITYSDNDVYVTPQSNPVTDVQVNGTSIISNGVANIPMAGASPGVAKVSSNLGINIGNDGYLTIGGASSSAIKTGTTGLYPIAPNRQHESTFYGLAKAAGDNTQSSSSNAIGAYTADAKVAIQSMLGVPGDVQVNGTSVVSNGVANVPVATSSSVGVSRPGSTMWVNANGALGVNVATSTNTKAGTTTSFFVTPNYQHESTFYGLAKASGVDMSSSSNAVGTYTDAAKASINTMIGSVSKDSLDDAGITARTYTTKFDGEFTVTTVSTTGYNNPYARSSVTGRINKENMHRVTFNGTEYILRTRLWYYLNNQRNEIKVYEYLGNLNLFVDDISGVPGGTDNVPFIIISDYTGNNEIDVLTQTAGTYTIKVEQISNTQKELPKSLIYGDSYPAIEKNNNGGTYNGFSIGVNELNNKRATVAIGYGNKVEAEFSDTIGKYNLVNSGCNNSHLIGTDNRSEGRTSYAFGELNHINSGYAMGLNNHVSHSGTAIGTINDVDNAYSIGLGLKAKYGATAVGFYNVDISPITHPEWIPNTLYHIGDIVHATYNGADLGVYRCLSEHTSGSFFLNVNEYLQWKNIKYSSDTAFVVGNGFADTERRNGLKVTLTGDGKFGGDVYVNCNDDSSGGTKLTPLPSVTSSDNDKFLRVVNGAWAAATVPNAEAVSF